MVKTTTVTILIPRPLRDCCGGASDIATTAGTVRALLADLEGRYPELYRSVCDETGNVRRHIHLFVNSGNTRDVATGLETRVEPGDTVSILPAVSGG